MLSYQIKPDEAASYHSALLQARLTIVCRKHNAGNEEQECHSCCVSKILWENEKKFKLDKNCKLEYFLIYISVEHNKLKCIFVYVFLFN